MNVLADPGLPYFGSLLKLHAVKIHHGSLEGSPPDKSSDFLVQLSPSDLYNLLINKVPGTISDRFFRIMGTSCDTFLIARFRSKILSIPDIQLL